MRSECLYVCLSVLLYISKTHIQTSQNFLYVIVGRGSVLLWRQCKTLCTSGFVDDVMFSHSGSCGALRWQYRPGRRAAASSHKFPTYSPGGATTFDFVVIHNIMAANCALGQSMTSTIALLTEKLINSYSKAQKDMSLLRHLNFIRGWWSPHFAILNLPPLAIHC